MKKIKAFKANNGQVFETEKEAVDQDNLQRYTEEIKMFEHEYSVLLPHGLDRHNLPEVVKYKVSDLITILNNADKILKLYDIIKHDRREYTGDKALNGRRRFKIV